jgi:predicted DNA-binding transcriptional regulator AlpA
MQNSLPYRAIGPEDHRATDGECHERLVPKMEVCDRLGVSYPHIWLQVRAGRFPPGRYFGGKLYWLESEIVAVIAGLPRQAKAGEPPPLVFPGVKAGVKSPNVGRPRGSLNRKWQAESN